MLLNNVQINFCTNKNESVGKSWKSLNLFYQILIDKAFHPTAVIYYKASALQLVFSIIFKFDRDFSLMCHKQFSQANVLFFHR